MHERLAALDRQGFPEVSFTFEENITSRQGLIVEGLA
jgi:hypothetical protein